MEPKKEFMEAAIEEALRARKEGDYAIGSIVVLNDEIITRAMNRVKLDEDPTNHSEIVSIRQATRKLKTRHLTDCILYTTNEPCPMCSGAIVMARMKGLVYGATIHDMTEYAIKYGTSRYAWRTVDVPALTILERGDPPIIVTGEFMREECRKLFHS